MAQKVNIVLIDDIDGSEAAETVRFGLDGTAYEIDLSEGNASALREALAPYVTAGRKAGKAPRGKAASGSDSGLSKADRDAIREWSRSAAGKKAGVEPLGGRGRIPGNVIDAWQAATA